MTDKPRNSGRTADGRFTKGNPGRPPGVRHKITLAAEAILDGEAEALTRKAVEKALEGDSVALRLCLERIVPARKDRPVVFDLPKLESVSDAMAAIGNVIDATTGGDLTPGEAAEITKLLEAYVRAREMTDLEVRLKALEEMVSGNGKR